MAYRYIQISSLSEAHDDEQICAVYDNPMYNTTGRKNDGRIIKAFEDSRKDECKLVVWRNDDNKDYYRYIDKHGMLRERETAVCKILQFDNSRNAEEGYTYFAKAVLDSICDGEPGSEDLTIQVEDADGNIHTINSAYLNRDTGTVTLKL